jgi:hypothetical protein
MQVVFLNSKNYSHKSDNLEFPVSITAATNHMEQYFLEMVVHESDLKEASNYITKLEQIEIKKSGRCFCVISSKETDVKIFLLHLLECHLIDAKLYKKILINFPYHENETRNLTNLYELGLTEVISNILNSTKYTESQISKQNTKSKNSIPPCSHTSNNSLNPVHDINFNHRHKALYESKLSAITMKYGLPYFMPVIKKVNRLIYDDIKKCMTHSDTLSNLLKKKIIDSLKGKMFELDSNPQIVLNFCRSSLTEHFELQMDLQYEWMTFFTAKEKPTAFFEQAIHEKWTKQVNLERFLADIIKYRDDLYEGRVRAMKQPGKGNTNLFKFYLGICDQKTELDLNLKDRTLLTRNHPITNPGIYKERIVGGSFFKKACFTYDLPSVCGPSGTMAKRLALANQAELTSEEKELYAFVVGMHQISIASHSIDEIFSVATHDGFSAYKRGHYQSIFPDSIKQFSNFYNRIQALNEEYSDFPEPKDVKTTDSLQSRTSPG